MTTGAEYIVIERERQVSRHGWTAEHDALCHTEHQLSNAAESYLLASRVSTAASVSPPWMWPWGRLWWNPSEDPVRNLVKAGALIAAEIDRLLGEREQATS